MKKYVLREMGLTQADKVAKSSKKILIVFLWLILTVSLIAGTFLGLIKIIKFLYPPVSYSSVAQIDIQWEQSLLPIQWTELIVAFIVYLVLKSVITNLFVADKENSTAVKFLSESVVPSCYCREGLKVWHTVLIYLVPFITVYTLMFTVCVITEAEGGFMTMLFLIIPFMTFDLLLVLYIIVLKIRDSIKFIAVNNHIYNLTVYK